METSYTLKRLEHTVLYAHCQNSPTLLWIQEDAMPLLYGG
jgi:hypothetical protein